MRVAPVLALLLLAGCSAPASSLEDPGNLEAAKPTVQSEPASFTLRAAAQQQCVVLVCDAGQGPEDAQRTELLLNRSLTAVDLTFTAADAFLDDETQVRITLACDGGRNCDIPSAEVVGRPPLTLRADFASWPRGRAMLLSAYLEGPAASAYTSFNDVRLDAAGTYTFEQDPALPDAAPVSLERMALRQSGEAYICSPNSPGCGGGGFRDNGPFDGVVVEVVANVTWTSNSPESEELVGELYCTEEVPGGYARCEGTEEVRVSGRSPLRFHGKDLGYRVGSTFRIAVFSNAPLTPAGGPIVPQALELEGHFLLRPSAE